MMGITVIQISQMIGGIAIIATAVFGPEKAGCGKWLRDDWWGAAGAGFMYFSYFVLFGKLFVDNYVRGMGGEMCECVDLCWCYGMVCDVCDGVAS